MKKLLFATLALVLVLATGCKNNETKTDPQQEDTKVNCTFTYETEGEIMENVDVEIYVNDSLVCTLNDSIKEYKNTFDGKAVTTINTKPIIKVTEAPTDKFDVRFTLLWKFTDDHNIYYTDDASQNSGGCDPDYWESDIKPGIEKGLTHKFVIANGKVTADPVEE